MQKISQPTQVQERGGGAARCESQVVISPLEAGSESTAPQQPKEKQQQFETKDKAWWSVIRRGLDGSTIWL